MQHTGLLFLSRQRPQAGRTRCGAFQVQLHAHDRIDACQAPLWCITWTGPAALRFWQQHEGQLKPGAALQVQLERARLHTLYTRPPSASVHARVISLALVPRVQAAKPTHPHHAHAA